MIETRDGDVATREAFKLAELFKKMVEDHKARAPLLEQFSKAWRKLQIQMKSFEESFSDCFDIVQKIADCASTTSGSSTDIGTCMSKIVIRHRDVGIKLGEWIRELSSGLEHIQIKTANCKTGVNQLDKDHGKQLKKMRSVMKKRSGSLVKLDKKIKEKRNVSNEYSQKKEYEVGELLLQCKEFEEQEKTVVLKMAKHERELFAAFLVGIHPVLMVEMSIFQETNKIDEAIQEIDIIIGKEAPEFEASDGQISILRDKQEKESVSSHLESVGQRTSSLLSLNSFSGSRLSCNAVMDSSCSEPKLIHRASSLSTDSHDSGIDPCQPTTGEYWTDAKTSFVPIDRTQNCRYSTIRRSPSPFRSSSISVSDSPDSIGRITSKPPLPRRFPVPVRSPSIEKPDTRSILTKETPTESEMEIPNENFLRNAFENEATIFTDDMHIEVVDDIPDSPTEEDQEVLFYMTRDDETGSDEWEIPSSASYESVQEAPFHQFMHLEDLPPPPDFWLQ